jgi:small subunit ribosomal protein S2
MAVISMKALLESGVHFGHRTNKWDPRMKPYIFTERNGIHIIDLQQTVKALNNAYTIVRDCVMNGGVVLFAGTKRQAQETVREEALRAGMPYVTERWLGGMLTNWNTMFARIQEMERLESLRDTGEINRLTKKEGLLIEREITRLNTRLEGVRAMKRLPDLVFIVDVGREDSAVRECNLLHIPIVALVDTNCNPQDIDYVIPSNDDAIRAIKLLVAKIADAVLEGKAMRKDDELAEEQTVVYAATTPAPSQKAGRTVDTDEETDDAALLGKATLAKLAKTTEVEIIADETPVLPAETVAPEVVAEEIPAKLAKTVEPEVVAEEIPVKEEAPVKPAKRAKKVVAEVAAEETPAKPAKRAKKVVAEVAAEETPAE